MDAFDPNFEHELSPDLWRGGNAADAIRAALLLPQQVRFHAARQALFLAAIILAPSDEVRAGAATGLRRAGTAYDQIRDILAEWRERTDLHPALGPLFELIGARECGAIDALDAFRAIVLGGLEAHDRGEVVDTDIYNEAVKNAYTAFNPSMMALSEHMVEAGRTLREASERKARAAQGRALEARARIESIARTVRLISLNARVEAARAGEAGRAFGVIAEEIKSLSEQTSNVSATMGDSLDEIMSTLHQS